MKYLKNQKGFTLAELLVGTVIMAILMGGVFNVLSSSMKTYQYSQKRTYESQQARKAFLILTDDIRKATAITPDKGNTVTITPDNGQIITYTVDSTSYTVQFGAGTQANTLMENTQPLTTNIVQSFSIVRDGSDGRITTVTITLNDAENTSSGNYVVSTKIFSPNLIQ